MKIQIRDEEKKEPEVEMNLYLQQEGDKVKIFAVDERGTRYTIGKFSREGLHICGSITRKTGWPLDKHGKIRVSALSAL